MVICDIEVNEWTGRSHRGKHVACTPLSISLNLLLLFISSSNGNTCLVQFMLTLANFCLRAVSHGNRKVIRMYVGAFCVSNGLFFITFTQCMHSIWLQ